MLADGTPNFELGDMQVFGDPTEGESQLGKVIHRCNVTNEAKDLPFYFRKSLSGERLLVCPDCHQEVTVLKELGIIEIIK